MLTKIIIIFLNKYPTKNCKTIHFTYINQALLYSMLQDVRKEPKELHHIIAIYSFLSNISESIHEKSSPYFFDDSNWFIWLVCIPQCLIKP